MGLVYLHSICFLLLGHSPAKVSNKCSPELLELDACGYEPSTELHISVVFNLGHCYPQGKRENATLLSKQAPISLA
jgi:hypothetical protein